MFPVRRCGGFLLLLFRLVVGDVLFAREANNLGQVAAFGFGDGVQTVERVFVEYSIASEQECAWEKERRGHIRCDLETHCCPDLANHLLHRV